MSEQLVRHYFPIVDGKYDTSMAPHYNEFAATQLAYRELVEGDPFTITDKVVDGPTYGKHALEQLQRDIVENQESDPFELAGVIIPAKTYGLKKPVPFVYTSDLGRQPPELTIFFPWSNEEFARIVPTTPSVLDPTRMVYGIDLIPIRNGVLDYESRMVIISSML